jgi:hypothetical protein
VDYRRDPKGGFLLLQQDGPMEFTASGLPLAEGRWLTMDAGDWDRDGDEDIVLGAHNQGPHQERYPPAITKHWRDRPVPLLLLRNTTK